MQAATTPPENVVKKTQAASARKQSAKLLSHSNNINNTLSLPNSAVEAVYQL